MGYMYKQTIEERGYVDVDWRTMSQCELEKSMFVNRYLTAALHHSNCGWDLVEYKVMKTQSGIRTEFLVLWAEEIDASGSRWINVTGDSLGAIMCEMCENLW